ncbi:TonB-dependent hemoglobin/transferrin/lactoferrin family receptor [Castellaniella sp.]|uniref:TonB-dependent hemoglobin/transferrin/lactoferrin family receptor n=1 Tax=Castellaniella sp. TaxID=1955812 RepID=UPI003A8D707B
MELDSVTILGTKTALSTDEQSRSIDVVRQKKIDLQQGNNLGALVEDLPNVHLTGSPRPGGQEVQIRGLSGNRILTLIDSVGEGFSKGHLGNSFIDPDLLKQIDVERGPASVLWGNGALGGVISAQTKDAADLLAPGQSFGARLKGGYQSAAEGWLGNATIYGMKAGSVDGLVSIAHRDNGNIRLGGGETLPYSAYRGDSILAKVTLYPTDDQLFRLSHRTERLKGDTLSNPAGVFSIENPLLARQIERNTSQLQWQWTPDSHAVDFDGRLYHSRTAVDESASTFNRQDHTAVDTYGFNLTNSSRLDLALGGEHTLTYGVDGSRDQATGSRNGAPRPEFPDAERRLIAAFAQDQISLGDWTATFGVRYDHYHSEAGRNIAPDQDDSHTSYQAGLVWRATDWLSAYASYAEAFRAPSLDELYPTGVHFGANRFVPNPKLRPERAANKEIGLRARWQNLFEADDQLRVSTSVFRNDVRDFIDTIVTVSRLPVPPYVGGTTRSENVTNARLQGVEINARYLAKHWFLGASYGQTRGTNKVTSEPLADVSPDRWVVQAGLRALPWKGEVMLQATFAQPQNRVPAGTEETPGYAVYDLLTRWAPRKDLTLNFAVGNLADKIYRQHNAAINETGRNIKASLVWNF